MASMMDEMQKTLARRRAKVEKGDDVSQFLTQLNFKLFRQNNPGLENNTDMFFYIYLQEVKEKKSCKRGLKRTFAY